MSELDQGTIIVGVRSSKYPDVQCYGIIITASCDIENEKVGKLYYLIGVKVQRWFCSEFGFHLVYDSEKNKLYDRYSNKCQLLSLDADTLLQFSKEDVEKVLETQVKKNKDRSELKELYERYLLYIKPDMNEAVRRLIIQQNSDPVVQFVKNVDLERTLHYFYLPESTYMSINSRMDTGLIVDLQEIDYISLSDAKKIITPGIDNLIIGQESATERDRLKKKFWLNDPDDFVDIEGKIVSPWREHLMQRFTHDFTRIGVNRATEDDYSKMVRTI